MNRKPKGSVGIESFQGRLRLRLPRSLTKTRYLTLGLADTPINRKIAEAKAKLIESDIVFERFDSTLKRYQAPTYQKTPETELTLLELWEMYAEFKSHSLSVTTINSDFRRIRNHIQSLPPAVAKDAKATSNYLIRSLSPDAARRVLMQLRACCRWAVSEGFLETNPFAVLPQIRLAKTRSINPFTRQERDLIIQAFSEDKFYSYYTPFVRFLFWTGCRTSEAVGLQWRHIDSELKAIAFQEAVVNGVRKDTKTHSVRRFPVNVALKSLLQGIQPTDWNPDRPVFIAKEGGAIDPHNFLNRAWRSVLSGLPIDYRPQYNTRHTFISLCLEEGVPVTQVAAWVGNSPKTIWMHYAGLVNLSSVPEP